MKDDGQSAGFEVILGAFANFGEEQKQRHKELLNGLEIPRPIRASAAGSILTSGTSRDTVALTGSRGPAAGRMWVLRNVVVSPNPVHQTITGTPTFDLYAGETQQAGNVDFLNLIGVSLTLPYVNNFGLRHVTLYHGETVYANIQGITTANIQIVIAVKADDFKVSDVEAMRA